MTGLTSEAAKLLTDSVNYEQGDPDTVRVADALSGPRFALPDTDLLNGDPVLQIALLHEGNVPIVVDIDLDTSVVSDLRADVTLPDVCREVKRMRLAGTLPPVQVIMFYTSFPDSNDPAPRMMWLYDRDALANRTLMCDADYVHATFETWAIVPSEG